MLKKKTKQFKWNLIKYKMHCNAILLADYDFLLWPPDMDFSQFFYLIFIIKESIKCHNFTQTAVT